VGSIEKEHVDPEKQADPVVDVALESQPAALYRQHAGDLRRLLLALLRHPADAEDALQQVFLKLLEHHHSLRAGTAKSWLFTVAYHEAMTVRRRRGADTKALTGLWSQPVWRVRGESSGPPEEAVRAEIQTAVQRALAELPENQRIVVHGRIYEGKTFATLAAEQKVPLGTVLTRMRIALKTLQPWLEE
jgi:RNA polymerase sigma factor (sigma-70 family)